MILAKILALSSPTRAILFAREQNFSHEVIKISVDMLFAVDDSVIEPAQCRTMIPFVSDQTISTILFGNKLLFSHKFGFIFCGPVLLTRISIYHVIVWCAPLEASCNFRLIYYSTIVHLVIFVF
jgi:hypothetical protein